MHYCRYADGTFKTAPPLFAQVYTIHGIKYSNVIPAVYALLPDQTTDTYTRVLNAIKFSRPNVQPTTIMTDFEIAQINAYKNAFPNIETKGCFFHLRQSIYRHIKSDRDILSLYEDENTLDNALYLRQIPALAFVPPDVIQGFSMLLDTDFFKNNMDTVLPLLDYFEDTYLGRPVGNGMNRRNPRFAIKMWNCFESVIDDLPKTNNSVEGWHRAFSSLIDCSHPTIWKFIDGIKQDQSINELKLEQYLAGEHPSQNFRRQLESVRFQTVVNEYGTRNMLDYFRGIAHNLTYPTE
ncbi:uncharacterized protein B4U80_09561 [Leptotrombidium deliense]|uniref:MULE transposase domain-containing protein n=1 Tax=Leptotrombidium deliense TaxID=299467 RepID=A0A443S2H9_9ACAR|nr:uncharacterized protein B4U80_09561 [Leptotrombidium deliense]